MARTTGSDELFRLIKSLSTEEKGYFKKFAMRHTTKINQYLKLFDAINRQEVYDDKTLKKQFRNLPTLKNYLFELILQSVILSGSDTTAFEKILQGMLRSGQLLKRGLVDKALQLMDDNIELAHKTDSYSLEAILRLSKYNILRTNWSGDEMLPAIKKYQQQIAEVQSKQHALQKLQFQQHVGMALMIMEQHGKLKIRVEDELDLPYLQKDQSQISDFIESNRLMAQVFVHGLKGDIIAQNNAERRIYEIEQKRYLKSDKTTDIRYYLHAISNYAGSCIEMRDYNTVLKLAEILGSITLKNRVVNIDTVINYIELKQIALWRTGNHEEGEKFTASLLKKYDLIKMLPKDWWHIVSIYEHKLMFEFSIGLYGDALKTMQFFNLPAVQKLSVASKTAAEMIYILVQYEIKNYEIIPSIVRSVLRRNKNLSEARKYFLSSMAKNATNTKVLLAKLNERPSGEILYPYFTFEQWLQSKKLKIPLRQVVKQANLPGTISTK